MAWSVAKPQQFDRVIEFLRPREHTCVTFVSHLLKGGVPSFPSRFRKRILYLAAPRSAELGGASGGIAALALQTTFGLVFPVLDTPAAEHDPQLGDLVHRLRRGLQLSRTLMGREADVRRVESALSASPDMRVTYHIMSLTGPPASGGRHPPQDVTFRRAGPADLSRLLPLQAAYEEEEVIVDGRPVDHRVVYHNMHHALEHHVTYIAERNGTPVAKASTNAHGLHYEQIGGVYTVTTERNKGIGTELMRYLIADLRAQGKSSTLFVKKFNAAARAVYERLGFVHKNDFAISYYYQ
ncbi:MAG: GNAT family N-acetyltransferase [Spirochaetaceae bacterium]